MRQPSLSPLCYAFTSQLDLSGNTLCGINPNTGEGTYTAEGIKAIADALKGNASMTSLNLSENNLTDSGRDMTGITAISEALKVTASMTSVNVLSNKLDVDSATILLKVKAEKPSLRTLCGLTHNETELNLRDLGPGDAKLLAAEILGMASLTRLDVRYNYSMGDEGKAVLRKAAEGHSGFELQL